MYVRCHRWIVPFVTTASLAFSAVALAQGSGATDLLVAAKARDLEAMGALLERGADVNAAQGDGATALHWAAHWDDHEMAELLIGAGATVNVANNQGATPLWLACTNGSAAMIGRFLQAGADPNAVLSSGETPVMTASRTGTAEGVRLLLTNGADVNARERSRGQTALMWATAQQHPEVMRVLIEHDADIHARSHVWHQLVNTAGNTNPTGDIEVAQGGSTPLLFTARQGDLESARLLLAAGANVNDAAPSGTSALVVASHSGHPALAVFLLEAGADPNAADAGYTALHAAVLRGDLELVKTLIAHGADPNARLVRGTAGRRLGWDLSLRHALIGATPFLLAAKYAEVDIMRVLAANGADPLLVKQDGTTPLMVAMGVSLGSREDRRGREGTPHNDAETEERLVLEIATLAVDLGVDFNASNDAGNTALHGAARLGLNSVVQFLADRGARLDVKNTRDQTPLALASRLAETADADRETTADLLRRLGAQE